MSRNTHKGHTAAVTSVAWYPVDAGLFVSASLDATTKVWDPNAEAVVSSQRAPAQVTCVAMSAVARVHMQAAATCEDGNVRLLDLGSGATTQVRDSV